MPPTALTALTIGNFDGVHLGHAALLRACRDTVGPTGRVLAMAFDPHPASTLAPGREPPRLTTFPRRAALLRSLGADEVIRLEPTPAFLNLSPEQFTDLVIMPHAPAVIVEGDDFHFGHRRAGTINTLTDLGRSRNFSVQIVPPVELALTDQLIVRASSTLTRWLLAAGRVRDAALVLARPYTIDGIILPGDQRGRTIGFPTANLATDQLLPADGVYAGTLTTPDGITQPAAINIGARPTFNGIGRRLEAFVMQPDGSAAILPQTYHWSASVTLDHWIRDDLKFDGLDSLLAQIRRDVRTSLELLPA